MVGGSEGKPTESTLERSLAPETQIRRLTAQLTAAYNRIAALEEQLLASPFSFLRFYREGFSGEALGGAGTPTLFGEFLGALAPLSLGIC